MGDGDCTTRPERAGPKHAQRPDEGVAAAPVSAEASHAREAVAGLSARQSMVLRAVVGAYIGEAGPIGSPTLTRLLPVSISPASIRTTLAELAELGLLRKVHRSAGSEPTELGLRVFVDAYLDPIRLEDVERRELAGSFADAPGDGLMDLVSQLLSERTHLLGFAVPPRLDLVILQHLSLVRLSSERVLAVLISRSGVPHRRIVHDPRASFGDQAELDRVAQALNAWIAGRSIREARELLVAEARALRHRADRLHARAVEIGSLAISADAEPAAGAPRLDLVVGPRAGLLDERVDVALVRALLAVVESKQRLVRVLDSLLEGPGVQVAFGRETEDPHLEHCALVVAPYGQGREPMGVVGVLGPSRMNYARVIPIVEFLSELVSENLVA